jgi:hypothetical protein
MLRSDAIDERMHGRLINWGRWLRADNTLKQLDYPSACPFVFSPPRGGTLDDLDAEEIEWVVSSLACGGGRGALHAFVLRIEYAERPDGQMPPVQVRARDVARKYKQRCSRSTYYNLLRDARKAVALLAA